jgi:hypothetical protein
MGYAGLVALGPKLCREAIMAGRCANESHLLLHAILTDMLREDINKLPSDTLQQRMQMRFRQELALHDACLPD